MLFVLSICINMPFLLSLFILMFFLGGWLGGSECRKVEQVAEEADSLKESLDKYFMRNQRRMQEAKERAELLGRAVCDLLLVQRL